MKDIIFSEPEGNQQTVYMCRLLPKRRAQARIQEQLKAINPVQNNRDDTRSQSVPAGDSPSRRRPRAAGKKTQRALNQDDMLEALKQLQSRSEPNLWQKTVVHPISRTCFFQ